MSKSVAFYTLGCKLNFSESSAMQRTLQSSGFRKGTFEEGADVYVINTCSVTDHADRKCKRVVKEALSYNPNALIAVVGCYAQLKPMEIAAIPGVDIVLGAGEKFQLGEHLQKLSGKQKSAVYNCDINDVNDFVPSYSLGDRTRTFLKVQDGCDYICTYCTIPMARGKSRSPRIADIVAQANEIAAQGVKEIVLTGVNTGDFGVTHNETFLDLIKALDTVPGIQRFRISSIEPNLLSDEIIEFVAGSQKFVPHFHIPLQSGSDKILKLMRRRYMRKVYTDRVAKIRSLMPHCGIGVDVIVGFPGETDEDFNETVRFIEGLDVTYLHVFTYSERPNTVAAELSGRVPDRVRFERNAVLRDLSVAKKKEFYSRFVDTEQEVLWEADYDNGVMHGFTENYIKVQTAYQPELVNTMERVRIQQFIDEQTMAVERLGELTGV